MSIVEALVSQFDRMVRRDGGKIVLLDASDDTMRIGYKPGADPECAEDVCIMPHLELQAMMQEALDRRMPGVRLKVVLQEN
ncbi:MAG: hypothetical protein JWR80_8800 [Bradyrhizobium sp.]|nr:hypothetical protein [Bradyrhizobium sp.]